MSVDSLFRKVGEHAMVIKKVEDKILNIVSIRFISIIVILIITFMCIATEKISQSFIDNVESEIKLELKQKVDIAYNTIAPILKLKREGKITEEEARKNISDIVKRMIYDDTHSDNYIFMSTYDGYYLVQPFEPEKEGTNMWDVRDSNGTYVIQQIIRTAKNSPNGSYISYFCKLPNSSLIEKKLTYVRGIPEINAYIGTGAYINLKYKKLYCLLNMQKIILMIIIAVIIILMVLYTYKLHKVNCSLNSEIKNRLKIEKELKNEKDNIIVQKSRLETLFNYSQDAIVEFDTSGIVLNVNKSFEKTFGYSKEECLRKNIDKLISTEETYNQTKKLTLKIMEEETINIEAIRYKKDKTPINVLVRSIYIKINNNILGVYGIYTDITEIKKYERKLEYMSIYDALTGLHNLNYFNKKINEYENNKLSSVGIIMCDLNGLKLVNDTLGHQYGDILLKNFAYVLKKSVREQDVVARVGGDEFSVILTDINRNQVKKIIKRINSNIEEFNKSLDEKMLRLSVAIGCSILEENKNIEEVIKDADDIMYRNKLINKASSKNQILSVLMAALAEKDFVTLGHTERVANMCMKIADEMGLDEERKSKLILLSEVHDLGKIAISNDILNKEGDLSEKEWSIMKSHTEKGYRIALNSNEISSVADLILKHHERWDGKGYPLGLKKYDIPIECRILAVVDAYDAMTNPRPYNKIKSHEEAIEEIKKCSGTQFDPKVVDIFISIVS
ncbi:cyclic di-GMP phosphodiesterase response regulator RpfG [Clostridium tepidiprofundi DSM 19306]|uniref:Cyclic di-GMP phosphodiesterase response regulator RpfG n=1 Tax=Clostridium tepidiprofundi DSM 19306 TaxID=1121338 RepID=A0A151B4C1_9CLOT|nr:diguanylate cyclase [Clostridium tepidiprofundi]KYH34758.1 cyclic di-GMP phosphodiesterase response regulator RpfG [Clostridium tepidiprofundi DSM 19306]